MPRRILVLVGLVACRPAVEREAVDQPSAVAEPAPPTAAAPVDDASSFEGRPIAKFMSFHGADWLTRPERIAEEDPDALHRELAMKPGQTACDIGAGNGYHSVRLAQAVAPGGTVLAVDIQPEMLELLRERVREAGVTNVQPVLATEDALGLADGVCDLELLVDVYHELAKPEAAIAALHRALAPTGRLAIVEFRGEDPLVPVKPEHKMTRAQVLRELEPRGFRLVDEYEGLPWQHLLVFGKRELSR